MPYKLEIKETEMFDDRTGRFVTVKPTTLSLEHSLISVSKWESKYHIPFLDEKREMTGAELDYYIQCMTINPNVNPAVYACITPKQVEEILEYIKNPMTATWFGAKNNKRKGFGYGREIITSELIYGWMVSYGVPAEYEKWHLNRLLTLLQVCNEQNTPPKKMSKNDIIRDNDAINAARRAAMHSRG